ncbi:hypothetical protein ACPV5V_22610, partial [Vibrio campbellii]
AAQSAKVSILVSQNPWLSGFKRKSAKANDYLETADNLFCSLPVDFVIHVAKTTQLHSSNTHLQGNS